MEYEHEMNAFMTPRRREAFTLEGTLCPDAAQSADTYAFTLEAGVAPGPDGLQGGGRLMIGTEDMPELTGLSFELYEAEPSQLGGTDVALESLSEEQLSALIERFTTALSGCLEAMPVGAMAAAESPTENGFSALELPADEILDHESGWDPRRGSDPVDADRGRRGREDDCG